MSVSVNKHVWYDDTAKRWVSAPFVFLPTRRHKAHGRRRASCDSVQATEGGVR